MMEQRNNSFLDVNLHIVVPKPYRSDSFVTVGKRDVVLWELSESKSFSRGIESIAKLYRACEFLKSLLAIERRAS